MSDGDVDDIAKTRHLQRPQDFKESYERGLKKLKEMTEDPHSVPIGGSGKFCNDWDAMATELIRKREGLTEYAAEKASSDFERAEVMVRMECCPRA